MSDEEHEIFQDKRDERDSLLKEWRDMLDLFESSSNILPNKDLRTIMMLKTRHLHSIILSTASYTQDEMVYDNYSEFNDIVTLVEEFFSFPISSSMSLNILVPIYYTIYKCRDPALRRRALVIAVRKHQSYFCC